MSHIHWVERGTGTPKDRDEVNSTFGFQLGGERCETVVEQVPVGLRSLNS